MLSTAIALILFICLLVTLELSQRACSTAAMALATAQVDIEGLKNALVNRDKESRDYANKAREGVEQARALADYADSLADSCVVKDGRINNLCSQLEETRKGRRHYHDVAAERAKEVRTLSCELAESRLASFANLSDMTRLSALQQENKLDALCEVIKTLMQRDQLCDAAVASFGGRLSRAVQVYRKDRLKAAEYAIEGSPCLIPGLAHLMAPTAPAFKDF